MDGGTPDGTSEDSEPLSVEMSEMNPDHPNPQTDSKLAAPAPAADSVGRRGSSSFLLPVLATIGAAVFGKYAQKVAQWVVCAHSAGAKEQSCSLLAKVEALNIGTLVVTMIVIAGAAAGASRGKVTSSTAALSIVGALAGALFALLEAASQSADFPMLALLPVPLYFYLICVLLFALPLLLMPQAPRELSPAVTLHLRLASAVLVGAFFGYSAQLGAELYWKGLALREFGAQKFVVAPSATAIAAGAWAVAFFDPYLRPAIWVTSPDRRRLWLAIYGVGAILLAGGYGAVFDAQSGGILPMMSAALVVAGLTLPGLCAIALVLIFHRDDAFGRRSIAAAAFLGGVMAAVVATGLALFEVQSRVPSGNDILPFVVAQVLASVAMVLTVFGTHRLVSRWPDLNAAPTEQDGDGRCDKA